jgi:endonuclease-8
MPEGDTIRRIAHRFASTLAGRVIDHFEVNDQGEIREFTGRRVDRVEALGKHLLIHVEGGWSLRVHLGMHGRWHSQRASERRPRSPTALIVAGETAFICTRAYRAELIRTTQIRTHPLLRRLGPDIMADPPDIDAIVDRTLVPGHAAREIADVLIDQQVVAGIGNVYKSEALFTARIHPRTRVDALERDALRRLFTEAARLMNGNLDTARRTSVPLPRRPHPGSDRLWVYGRAGKPCLECGSIVERIVQGDAARSTWFCPHCQSSSGRSNEGG